MATYYVKQTLALTTTLVTTILIANAALIAGPVNIQAVDDDHAALSKPLIVQQELRLPGENGVKGLVNFTPDGKTLMVCQLRTVHFWDLSGAEPREVSTIKSSTLGVRDIQCAAISPDGKLVALGGYDKGVHLYALKDMQLNQISNQMEHDAAVRSLQFSHDGSMLASGGDDMALFLWDVSGGQLHERSIFKVENAMFGVQHIEFAPSDKALILNTGTGDVRQVAIGEDQPTQQSAWKELATLEMPMALSPDGKMLVFGSKQDLLLRNGGTDIACHGHSAQINSVAWSGDSQTCASGGEDGRLIVWDSAGHQRYSVQRPKPFDSVAFNKFVNSSTGGMWVAAANRNGTVYLLQLRDAAAPLTKSKDASATPL